MEFKTNDKVFISHLSEKKFSGEARIVSLNYMGKKGFHNVLSWDLGKEIIVHESDLRKFGN